MNNYQVCIVAKKKEALTWGGSPLWKDVKGCPVPWIDCHLTHEALPLFGPSYYTRGVDPLEIFYVQTSTQNVNNISGEQSSCYDAPMLEPSTEWFAKWKNLKFSVLIDHSEIPEQSFLLPLHIFVLQVDICKQGKINAVQV